MTYDCMNAYDWVAVERALDGRKVKLTDDDRRELARRMHERGDTFSHFAVNARLNGPAAHRIWDEVA